MNKVILITLLLLISLSGLAETAIDPISFEQIWFQNNQRNLFKRYRYYDEQVQLNKENLYLIGIDAAPDKNIKTSEGEKDALINRFNVHYQNQQFLFLIDWFSAVPQPQETEGFTYGDLVLGYTWRYDDGESYLTLGLRQKSTPRSIIDNSETVFNAVSDATREEYSIFFHINYHGYDFGTFYSEDNELEAVSFYMPLTEAGYHSFSSTISYYREIPDADLQKRYELSLDHVFKTSEYNIRSGVIVALLPDMDKYDVSNMFSNYVSPDLSGVRFIGGIYYYRDIENEENLPGAKLGLVWQFDDSEDGRITFSVQQNAIGDFNALIIRDEPIFTFSISSGLGDLF